MMGLERSPCPAAKSDGIFNFYCDFKFYTEVPC